MGSRNLSLMSENLFHFDVDLGLILFFPICLIRFFFVSKKDFLVKLCLHFAFRIQLSLEQGWIFS